MRVLVLGSKGMAGHMVVKYLKRRGHEVFTTAKNNASYKLIVDEYTLWGRRYGKGRKCLEEIISLNTPDVVVNCIGMLVKPCEDDIENAILINTMLPHRLEKLSQRYGFKLIHISTDCVFSGKVGDYKETDIPDGEDNYAKTKILGEVTGDHSLTIRTSIIGPELKDGTGLLHWFLKQDECQGWVNAYWSGVTTLELAKAIEVLVNKKITGLYHLTSKDKISKHNLLKVIAEVYEKDIKIIRGQATKFCDKSLVDSIGTYTPPSYYDMLIELKNIPIHRN